MGDFIPVNVPVVDGNELRYLQECIETGWISSEGSFVGRFETEFAARAGRKHAVAVCNGSAALDAALRAVGIGAGDEVITPALMIISCAAAIVRSGAIPVLVDSDPSTWNMRVEDIESRITERTKAVLVAHTYGLPVDMDVVLDVAARHNLLVIEDAAEMHGQTYRGKPCGSFGDISTFSFYSNKHITTGEGGMIVCDDLELAERCKSLRNLCFGKGTSRFVHEELGWNMRLSNLQAAVGVAQMERLDASITRKREIGRVYQDLLSDVENVQLPLEKTDYADNIYWVFGMVLKPEAGQDAAATIAGLQENGVGARPFFWPMHEQPVFKKMGLFENERHETAENLARRGFYVPCGLGLSDGEIEQVAAVVRKVVS